jgi:phosphoenolpyruvate---glycerone phosphotransferase subunit DhaL
MLTPWDFSSMSDDGVRVSPAAGRAVLDELVSVIHENAMRLSELDGATGDGDHGVNMDKGFLRAAEVLGDADATLPQALFVLGQTLLTEVGGAMGPLYGSCFLEMASGAGPDGARITQAVFGQMLADGVAAVVAVGGARVGDKTLLDVLVPAEAAFRQATDANVAFPDALVAMASAAKSAADGTREMVARIGRASRLGERSRGHVDAGAASCALILSALASSITQELTQ